MRLSLLKTLSFQSNKKSQKNLSSSDDYTAPLSTPTRPALKKYISQSCHTNSTMSIQSSLSLDSNTESSSRMKRAVSFSTLEIREYQVVLGDHPCVSSGPPVSLGWDYNKKKPVCIEKYEGVRPPRKNKEDMMLPHLRRRDHLLKNAGFSKEELTEASKEITKIKEERMASLIEGQNRKVRMP